METITEKQKELISRLDIEKQGFRLVIDEVPEEQGKEVVLDVEHDEAGNFVGVGLLWPPSNTVYYLHSGSGLNQLCFRSSSVIAHNGKSDISLLRQWGVEIGDGQLEWDTELYAHILDSSLPEYGLKSLAKRYLGIEYPSYDEIVGKRTEKQKHERITLDKQPLELVSKYNAFDVWATYKLYEYQKQKAAEVDRRYYEILEKPCSFIFESMESRGIRIDLDYLESLKESLESQIQPLEDKIKNELGPINLESPKQLLAALQQKGINPIWRAKPSTDKRALENVKGHPLVQLLLSYRELETLLSSFVYSYLKRGQPFVHPFFNQVGTRTGRLSCSNPNLLQIPQRTNNGKLVRQMFIARDGMLLGDCDFSAIEPRVLAHFSKDPALCEMFTKGIDFHQFTADALGISRDRAKVLNLSVGYRASWKSVGQQLKCGQYDANKEINKWWSLFPVLRRYQDKLIWDARKNGFCTTLLGRRIKIEGLDSTNKWKREAAERQLINNITQGSAAEIMKLAMINVNKNKHRLSEDYGILVQVYDELLSESSYMDNDMPIVKDLMENCVRLEVPLTVEAGVGQNWTEAKN